MRKKKKIFFHYGSASQPPMLSYQFKGDLKEFNRLINEAIKDNVHLKVQVGEEITFKNPK